MTFSRYYPSYHPKAGQPTHFVEKIFRSQITDEAMSTYYHNMELLRSFGGYDIIRLNLKTLETFEPKYHTIRAGHRWKVSDWFSPRVWSGKPYNSKQITIAPDMQVKKLWNITVNHDGLFVINGELYAYPNSDFALEPLARNDGLDVADLLAWFNEPLDGQIICWNENIEY